MRSLRADLSAARSGELIGPALIHPTVNPSLTVGTRRRGRRQRRVVEATEYAQMMRRMLRAHGRRVADCDIEDLADLIALRDVLDDVIATAVTTTRQRWHRSWSDIARATGTTKQAAHQRWGDTSHA